MLAVGIVDVDGTLLVLMLVDVTEMSPKLSTCKKNIGRCLSIRHCTTMLLAAI